MTTIMVQTPQELPSAASSIRHATPTDNDGLHQESHINNDTIISCTTSSSSSSPVALYRRYTQVQEEEGGSSRRERKRREREEGDQVSLLGVFVTVFRKSLVACKSEEQQLCGGSSSTMEISWPSNVRHVAHVTFDRFNGFLGLPVEFEPEVPRRPPSASIRVFGVSTESMQLSFDSRGNSVPTILLMMQRRLYSQGGLQAEGIFRINAENGQEEYVREQLNSGVVPDDIDVHCLAGLIKAWFRELPRGVLDPLSPDEVMQAQTEEECARLVRLLPPTEAALLDWAINLMADVAEFEHLNKMNARNVAMVFAPNMTQMADPLTALMYAVQVMNFLKTLIVKTLREREDSTVEVGSACQLEPFDENGHQSALQPIAEEDNEVNGEDQDYVAKEPPSSNIGHFTSGESELKTGNVTNGSLSSIENILPNDGKGHRVDKAPVEIQHADKKIDESVQGEVITAYRKAQSKNRRMKTGQSSDPDMKKGTKKIDQRPVVHVGRNAEKSREISIVSRLSTRPERVEAWR